MLEQIQSIFAGIKNNTVDRITETTPGDAVDQVKVFSVFRGIEFAFLATMGLDIVDRFIMLCIAGLIAVAVVMIIRGQKKAAHMRAPGHQRPLIREEAQNREIQLDLKTQCLKWIHVAFGSLAAFNTLLLLYHIAWAYFYPLHHLQELPITPLMLLFLGVCLAMYGTYWIVKHYTLPYEQKFYEQLARRKIAFELDLQELNQELKAYDPSLNANFLENINDCKRKDDFSNLLNHFHKRWGRLETENPSQNWLMRHLSLVAIGAAAVLVSVGLVCLPDSFFEVFPALDPFSLRCVFGVTLLCFLAILFDFHIKPHSQYASGRFFAMLFGFVGVGSCFSMTLLPQKLGLAHFSCFEFLSTPLFFWSFLIASVILSSVFTYLNYVFEVQDDESLIQYKWLDDIQQALPKAQFKLFLEQRNSNQVCGWMKAFDLILVDEDKDAGDIRSLLFLCAQSNQLDQLFSQLKLEGDLKEEFKGLLEFNSTKGESELTFLKAFIEFQPSVKANSLPSDQLTQGVFSPKNSPGDEVSPHETILGLTT
ncbi:MAG: hypothetical protein CMF51_03690 [Legionellales bacterium]|nr:hypothetical protein [Legionellales bacterium]